MNVAPFGIAILLLAANAFFVAVEFALVASRRARLEAMAADGHAGATRALGSIRQLSKQLAGAQLGITIASLLLGLIAEPAVAHLLEDALGGVVDWPDRVVTAIGFTIGLSVVVFLHMVLGEMVPKNVAIAEPERTLLFLDLPNRIYLTLFGPVISFLNVTANLVLRLLRVEPADELSASHTPEELADMISMSRREGLIAEVEDRMLRGALAIGEAPVTTVMIPRTEIAFVRRTDTPIVAEAAVTETGRSRLIVVGAGGIDDVLGYIHAKDLLSIPAPMRNQPLPLSRIRRIPIVAPDTIVDDVLLALRRARVHLAVVADGDEVLGLVSIDDALAQLVGEIADEHPGVSPSGAAQE